MDFPLKKYIHQSWRTQRIFMFIILGVVAVISIFFVFDTGSFIPTIIGILCGVVICALYYALRMVLERQAIKYAKVTVGTLSVCRYATTSIAYIVAIEDGSPVQCAVSSRSVAKALRVGEEVYIYRRTDLMHKTDVPMVFPKF